MSGEERVEWLSGRVLTPLNKWVFPVVWIGLGTAWPVVRILRLGGLRMDEWAWGLAGLLAGGAVFLVWFASKVMAVGHRAGRLVVSDGFERREVEFGLVREVGLVWWYRGRLVRVTYWDGRGERVVYYLPKWAFFKSFFSHPERALLGVLGRGE